MAGLNRQGNNSNDSAGGAQVLASQRAPSLILAAKAFPVRLSGILPFCFFYDSLRPFRQKL